MRTALSIAGSDSSGGAGIQADIKTMTMNGVFAMSAVTALTAQNTTGVTSVLEATPEFLADELDAVFTDIRPDAVKTGMVASSALIRVIAEKLRLYQAENIVVDPVMVATSGARLIAEEAVETLTSELLPLADVVTPNIPEAELLSGRTITTADEMVSDGRLTFDTDPMTGGALTVCEGPVVSAQGAAEVTLHGVAVSNPDGQAVLGTEPMRMPGMPEQEPGEPNRILVRLEKQTLAGTIQGDASHEILVEVCGGSVLTACTPPENAAGVSVRLSADSVLRLCGPMCLAALENEDPTGSNVETNGYPLQIAADCKERQEEPI